MANGHAALALVHDDYEPAISTETEIAIGCAMAAAAAAVGIGLFEGAQSGQLSKENVVKGGQAMTRVVELQLAHFGDDFGVVARRAGRQEIERRCGRVPALGLAGTIDELLSHVLIIAGRVVELERAQAH
jgi:hypothetical protein